MVIEKDQPQVGSQCKVRFLDVTRSKFVETREIPYGTTVAEFAEMEEIGDNYSVRVASRKGGSRGAAMPVSENDMLEDGDLVVFAAAKYEGGCRGEQEVVARHV